MTSSLRSDLGLSNNNVRVSDCFILKNRGDVLKKFCKLNKKGFEMSPQGQEHAPFAAHNSKSFHILLKIANAINESLTLFCARDKTEQFGLIFADVNEVSPIGHNVMQIRSDGV